MRIIIIMFCVTLVLWIADPSLADGVGILGTMGTDIDNTTINNTVSFNNSLIGSTNTGETGGFGSGTYIVITDLFRTMTTVASLKLWFSIFYAPATALANNSAPLFLVVIVGGIWTIMYSLAFIGFLRGRDV